MCQSCRGKARGRIAGKPSPRGRKSYVPVVRGCACQCGQGNCMETWCWVCRVGVITRHPTRGCVYACIYQPLRGHNLARDTLRSDLYTPPAPPLAAAAGEIASPQHKC